MLVSDIVLDRREDLHESTVCILFELPDLYPNYKFGFRFPAKNTEEPPMRKYSTEQNGPPEFWADIVWQSFEERLVAADSPEIPRPDRSGTTWI
ncbi:hypothetical protein CFN78_19585 [Amycolatopsis antarctica]|uniref:Uncharacterized protein n=1 Tax=Amycolatopsis antarctica TaxID=1854586 RepID=A0A263CYW6_9PSEU|nr:hypothetical protein CFN78_19585 [Amycolatopsis antarctica]